eukprot:CAMPEP_0183577766 /NCGR_PEP_ID=MMETSP0371-20130417/140446_1 /TAXON_ID=268820 /ORGANISM="Peridinium aciculiferum, Strain PAER-2" /LENGTH=39 /DNA_ID= /DNA_START= /DNA_END= /DNA_ORIENTATION=
MLEPHRKPRQTSLLRGPLWHCMSSCDNLGEPPRITRRGH